jgi:HEAT repeat protein
MDIHTLYDLPPWEWPENAEAMIIGLLQDTQADAEQRLLAAELAGDYTNMNDALADALLTVTSRADESVELRGAAVIALGGALEHAYTMGFEDEDDILLTESGFHQVINTLHQLFFDQEVPDDVRRRVLEASVRAPQDWHDQAVRDALNSDGMWRLTAVFCMRFISGFDSHILDALEDDNLRIRYHAVCAAGVWEIEEAWPHVFNLLTADDTDKELRLAAIDAVASIRPVEAAEILNKLTASEDDDIVDAAYEALAMAGIIAELEDEDDDDDNW